MKRTGAKRPRTSTRLPAGPGPARPSTGSSQRELHLRNRQSRRPVDLRFFRRITQSLLRDQLELERYEIGVHLVEDEEMTCVNETFLRHAGTTDVVTFDYREPRKPEGLSGELFICINEALRQAARYRTTWQSETVRYLVHGLLHLRGHTDLAPDERRKMKREENRLLKQLGQRFPLRKLQGAARIRP